MALHKFYVIKLCNEGQPKILHVEHTFKLLQISVVATKSCWQM